MKPLNCPACGRSARAAVFSGTGHKRKNTWYRVECEMADCWQGPVFKNEDMAVAAWNLIAARPAANEPVGAVNPVERIAALREKPE